MKTMLTPNIVSLWKLAKSPDMPVWATVPDGFRLDWWDRGEEPHYCVSSEHFKTYAAAAQRAAKKGR